MPVLSQRLRRALLVAPLVLTTSLGFLAATGGTADATAPAAIVLTSTSCPTLIQQGQTSGCVTKLQQLLNGHGYGLTVDGVFGAGTTAAVKAFQTSAGLGVDGIVGPTTKSRLTDTSGSVPQPIDLRSSSCPTNIQSGQSGGCVTKLQDLLNNGGAHIAVDGSFGPGTLAAVQSFQSAHGLTADGIVGPGTKAALYGTAATPSSSTNLLSSACPTLIRYGESDGCVTTLQSLLTAHGYSLTIDGSFGPATEGAVVAFQTSYIGASQADGIVGPATKAALYGNSDGAGGSGVPSPINLNSSACPTLIQSGQSGGCVAELQSLLNHKGESLAIDGQFGPATLGAVQNFQAQYNLTVDGVVGPGTKTALYGTAPPPPTSQPVPQSAAAAGALALQNVNATACGTNSRGGKGFLSSCTGNGGQPEYWCADFVQWVWGQVGLKTSGLNAGAVSFYRYGSANGTLHTSTSYQPQVGDAIVYGYTGSSAGHVGMVMSIASDGTLTTANGDFGGTSGSGEAVFSGTSHMLSKTIPPASIPVGSTPPNVGQKISAYVTPVGTTPTASGPPTSTGTGTIHSGFTTSTNLTKPSGLTADFINRFVAKYHPSSPLASDGQLFVNAERTYGVNAQYLVAHAMQESAWGMSPIAAHNYFGFAAYDSCPSSCAKTFSSDSEGINDVAGYIAENYLTPGGRYYTSPTLAGMSQNYATDPNWASNIAAIAVMEDNFS